MLLIILALLALRTPTPPAGRAPQERPQTPAIDEYEALRGAYLAAASRWRIDRARLTSDDERQAHAAKHPVHEYWPRFEERVRAGDARGLLWQAEAVEERGLERAAVVDVKRDAIATLVASHADAPWAATETIGLIARQRPWFDEAWVRQRIEELATTAKDRENSAAAWLALSRRYEGSRATPEDRARAAELRAKLAREFADTKAAKAAAEHGVATVGVKVGQLAPDFDAVDADGAAFKLSEYRGKVVLLDFWGFWCGPCVQQLPHVREITDRFAEEPFATIGVNTDTDVKGFSAKAKARDIRWRNALTGGSNNAISRRYQVAGYPTVLVIDHEGVIRRRYLGPPPHGELEKAIRELISAAKAAK